MINVIGTLNMTLDGVFDHTAVHANDEVHEHYKGLLDRSSAILLGRVTYQLMEYWRTVLHSPTGNDSINAFAVSIDRIPKLVFSNTLNKVEWETAELINSPLAGITDILKEKFTGDILVGSRSLIIQLLDGALLDELQICIHPVISGSGKQLFEDVVRRFDLELIDTQVLGGGAVILRYQVP